MTVSYSKHVSTSHGFGHFWKLLFRWRGSIYKLLWPELCLYVFLYYTLNLTYRLILSEHNKSYFEKTVLYCSSFANLIPVSFVLGFYVSLIIGRWWDTYMSMPWPDNMAFYVSTFINGQDERGYLMRRTIMRYLNLSFIITLICISPVVRKRFPSLDYLVKAGVLFANEKEIMENLKTSHPKYSMPLIWASNICIQARMEGRVRDDFALKTLVDEISTYRGYCGTMFSYDWVNIPLVYTQVVTLAVYAYFLASLMGSQMINPEKSFEKRYIDTYVPIFNFLQFFFYMGWLKVAEVLINPLGEDDDDFEVQWLIDRNIEFSYLVVDEMYKEQPELTKYQYCNEAMPEELPFTITAQHLYTKHPQDSAAGIDVSPEVEFSSTMPEKEEDNISVQETKLNVPLLVSVKQGHGSHHFSSDSCGNFLRPSYCTQKPFNQLKDLLKRKRIMPGNSELVQSRGQTIWHRKLNSKDTAGSQKTGQSVLFTPTSMTAEYECEKADIYHQDASSSSKHNEEKFDE
ncbi:bestrophin-4-like, partial [Limulus polyphemus]|uniref:Bestrophin homolog n=1 Tax=Limulus polyphemus TaxID=6850 RepID=A0ABM1BU50_LIMPO